MKVKIAVGAWIREDNHNWIVDIAWPRNPEEKRGKKIKKKLIKKDRDEPIIPPIKIQGITCRIKTGYFLSFGPAMIYAFNNLIKRNLRLVEMADIDEGKYTKHCTNIKKLYEIIKDVEGKLDPVKIKQKVRKSKHVIVAK